VEYDYDVIIAGGGMSAPEASAIGYYSKQRAGSSSSTETSPTSRGRRPTTAGSAATREQKSVQFIEKNIGIKYDHPELEHPVKGIYVYSPDHKTKVLFEGEDTRSTGSSSRAARSRTPKPSERSSGSG